MIKVNVRTVNYPLPKDEDLIFKDAHLNDEDCSGKTLGRLIFSNCKLNFCKFENMKVNYVCFGSGIKQTIFTNCSFDGSKFKGPTAGNVKFIRCSFINVDLNEFFFLEGEFIDCVFSGKMKGVIFYRKLRPSDRETANREFNEFQGNDFRDADFIDCDFRGGIDLAQQKLPVSEKYLYVENAKKFIEILKEKAILVINEKVKQVIFSWLKIYERALNQGQIQLFIELNELTKDIRLINEISAIFKDVANIINKHY